MSIEPKTHCKRGHCYNDAGFYLNGNGRNCKACNKIRNNKPSYKKAQYKRRRTAKVRLWTADYNLKYKYGISLQKYTELTKKQGGLCAVCNKPPTVKTGKNGSNKLVVDRDHNCCSGKHSCGKCVRGLLCSLCNKALGLLRDDAEALNNAIKYLESYQCL